MLRMEKKTHDTTGLTLTISLWSPATELLQPSTFTGRFHNGHYSQTVLKSHVGAIQVDYSHIIEIKTFNP